MTNSKGERTSGGRLPKAVLCRIIAGMEIMELSPEMPEEQVIGGTEVSIRLSEKPRRYYQHGWQSWSPATWVDIDYELPISKPHLLHPMQGDPLYARQRGHHGSWVGAVEIATDDVLLLGSLGLDAHVTRADNELRGSYRAGHGTWYVARGQEKAVFSKYAAKLGEILGKRPKKAVPRVWCSWYGLYTAIDQEMLLQVVHDLGDLPFDVIQVDDGWQRAVGDWQPNGKFPSGMKTVAATIRASGRRAGLWLSPLVAVQSSALFRTHPEWFLRADKGALVSAGFNWGEHLYALDTTRPDVLDWLKALMRQVREWGFDYIKLDFLYGSALPGQRHADMPREEAYRQGLKALREGMGEDTYFLACGAPIIPSLGLCDALRTGPDVAADWEAERDAVLLHNLAIPGVRNAIRTVLNRLWLRPLVQPDPDVTYFRSIDCNLTAEQKHLLQSLALICGFKATSDLPQWLSHDERERLREFLLSNPQISEFETGRFRVGEQEVDFRDGLTLPDAPGGWKALEGAALGWLANHPWALRLDHELNKRARERKLRRMRKADEKQ